MMISTGIQPSIFCEQHKKRKDFTGESRRAITFFPGKELVPKCVMDLAISNKLPFLAQLLDIEAKKLSCFVKMESGRFKSRSAVLIYRGRGIAYVYGSNTCAEQQFGKEAYKQMMSEMRLPRSEITSYLLLDEVVLAAAAMFHGGAIDAQHQDDPLPALVTCLTMNREVGTADVVAVLDHDNKPVCIIYLAEGGSMAINWLSAKCNDRPFSTLLIYLREHSKIRLLTNSIECSHVTAADDLTFDLLGLNEPQVQPTRRLSDQDAIRLLSYWTLKPGANLPAASTQTDRFIKSRSKVATRFNYLIGQMHPFRIDPAC